MMTRRKNGEFDKKNEFSFINNFDILAETKVDGLSASLIYSIIYSTKTTKYSFVIDRSGI